MTTLIEYRITWASHLSTSKLEKAYIKCLRKWWKTLSTVKSMDRYNSNWEYYNKRLTWFGNCVAEARAELRTRGRYV